MPCTVVVLITLTIKIMDKTAVVAVDTQIDPGTASLFTGCSEKIVQDFCVYNIIMFRKPGEVLIKTTPGAQSIRNAV